MMLKVCFLSFSPAVLFMNHFITRIHVLVHV